MDFFELEDFNCPCCEQQFMQEKQLKMLDETRRLAGFPFRVNSGWRCEEHNRDVEGSEYSAHLSGYATDIKVTTSMRRFKIIKAALAVGYMRIGVYKTFVHLDCEPNKPQEVIWY